MSTPKGVKIKGYQLSDDVKRGLEVLARNLAITAVRGDVWFEKLLELSYQAIDKKAKESGRESDVKWIRFVKHTMKNFLKVAYKEEKARVAKEISAEAEAKEAADNPAGVDDIRPGGD